MPTTTNEQESSQAQSSSGPQSHSDQLKHGSKKRTRHSETASFYGVRKRKWGRYVSEIRLPGQKTRIWLGSFVSPEMAARAHDSAAFFLKGNSACLNFPDSAGLLPRPQSCSRRDIQMAAAKAALEQPRGLDGGVGIERSESGSDPGCLEWWDDLESLPFESVREPPLLGSLRFDVVGGEYCFSYMDENESVMSSFCREL
ncbi:hypothetical protein SLE2022_236650 [Rubroshorea leprosula]